MAKKKPNKRARQQGRNLAPAKAAAAQSELVLLPRDGLFLKDGREWGPAGIARAHSLGWPAPSTVLGALRTAHGRASEQQNVKNWTCAEWAGLAAATTLHGSIVLRRRLGGPTWKEEHRVWPVPADAVFFRDDEGRRATILRLRPQRPTADGLGADDTVPMRALWWPANDDPRKPAMPPTWWSEAAFLAWLADTATVRNWGGKFIDLELPRHMQAHVGIERATQTAEDEILFAHDVVETVDKDLYEWAIGVQWTAPAGGLGGWVTLGGDRRLARVESGGKNLFEMPPTLRQALLKAAAVRLVAVTPAAFRNGWRPNGIEPQGNEFRGTLHGLNGEVILRAALVPRAAHVSGWDMQLPGPKLTTKLVPPGSVYFIEKATGGFSDDEIRRLWMIGLGDRQEEGFGRFVPGIWNPKEGVP